MVRSGGCRHIALTLSATDYKGMRGFDTNAVLIKRRKNEEQDSNRKQKNP